MPKSPDSTQDPPKKIAGNSILDMDPETLEKEFKDFSFTPPPEKIIYASSNSDPLKINFKTLSTLERDQTVREIESVKNAFYSLATSVRETKIKEIQVITRAIPVQVERLYEDLNNKIKKLLNEDKDKDKTLNTNPLAQIFIGEDPDNVTKAIESLATSENPKKNIDKAKLLIYGQLIDKIEEIDSHQIKEIYDKILDLKFKEVTLKKFLPSKEKTPAKIDVKTLFAEMPLSDPHPISQPKEQSPLSILLNPANEIKEPPLAKPQTSELIENPLRSLAYSENKILEPSPEQVRFEREITDLESEIKKTERKLDENSKSLNQKRKVIEDRIREILSPEYVEEKQEEDSKKSIMDQLLIEAIIIDEAKKTLDEKTIESLKNSHNNKELNLKILNQAFSIQKPQVTPAFSLSVPYVPGVDSNRYQTTIVSESSGIEFYNDNHELNSDHKEFKQLKQESRILEATLEELNATLKDKTQNRPLPNPPLPPEVAKLAEIYLAERRGEKALLASRRESLQKIQAELIKDNSEIEALRASKAEAIERLRRLESESSQIKQEILRLEKIKQQNVADSDSISLDMPNLKEVIAREEELKRVLEEKQRQESRTRIEALKIQQELQIQEALLRVGQDGEILGLGPGKNPNQSNEISWTDRSLAGLRGGKPQEPAPKQETSSDSFLPQKLYSPFSTLSDLQTLGAGTVALGLGNTQPSAPVQDLLFGEETLKPQVQTSLQNPPQNPQENAPPPFDQVASSRKLPAETSSIFMRASDEKLVTNENLESHSPPSDTELDKLFQTLSENEATPLSAIEAALLAEQLLGGLQSEDLTNLHQSIERENQILELRQTQLNQYSEVQVFQLQNTEQTRGNLGSAAQQDDAPPPSPANEDSQTILRTQEEKKQFWQTFISTRLGEKPSNSNQNLSGNNEDDLSQDELVTRSNPNSPKLESEDLNVNTVLNFSYSIIQPIKIDEIKERKRKLYTILKINLEKQNTTESDPPSKDEEEIDAKTAEENMKTIINHIATLTSDLASSISKVENNQTVENLQSKPLDTQTTQNSSTDDPIIYSGIGIRIKLEDENGEYSLKITEVFENSGIDQGDVNKKITHIKCGDELKSISDIYGDCGGAEEKFYTKIALIFRDENQKTLTLKIEGEEQERNVVKNIFIPEDKKGLNIYNNSQVKKIADKLRAPRETFRQLSTPRGRNA